MLRNFKRMLAVASASLLFRVFIGAAVAIGGFVAVPRLVERLNERPSERKTEQREGGTEIKVQTPQGSDAPQAFVQAAKLNDGAPTANMSFGFSVAASGDNLVGGAYRDSNYRGSISFFARSGTLWFAGPTLFGSDTVADDNFGWSVSMSGDTAIAGANLDDGTAVDQGSAYVFFRNPQWAQQQKLTASDGAADDQFGISVAVSGDTAVVGAFGANSSRGSAYVFTRSGTTWTQQQKLTAADGAAGDQFGWSVAVDGDTVVIGAHSDDGARGSAYVFKRNGTVWTQEAKLLAGDGATFDQFGYSVAVAGETAVSGAVMDDNGSAYVFTRSGSTWTQQQKLTASDGAAGDKFGGSVSISGERTIVGAEGDDIGSNADQGSAYLFLRSGTLWSQEQKLTASDGAASDFFGGSVSLSGNLAMVGSYLDDLLTSNDQGSAYAFVNSGATPTPTATPTVTPTPTNTPTSTPTSTPSGTPTATPTPGSGLEGDVAPRNSGDGQLLTTDVTQSRRFVAGLDTALTSPNEFQRADVAPAATLGDGVFSSSDTVQARRYAAGLDTLRDAGGPTEPTTAPQGIGEWFSDIFAYFSGRTIAVGDVVDTKGDTLSIPITVEAYGEVCAASFTIEFDPMAFTDATVMLGADAAEDSVLTVNTNESQSGRIAVLIDSVTPISAGGKKTVAILNLVRAGGKLTVNSQIRITDGIAKIGLSDANGNDLAVYTTGKAIN